MSLDIDLYMDIDVGRSDLHRVFFHEQNITSNLYKMAEEAGISEQLWNSDLCGVETAEQLAVHLKEGIGRLIRNPSKYKKFDSPNGWGKYDDFVPWLEELLAKCLEFPKAKILISK